MPRRHSVQRASHISARAAKFIPKLCLQCCAEIPAHLPPSTRAAFAGVDGTSFVDVFACQPDVIGSCLGVFVHSAIAGPIATGSNFA
ncbi:MAG: hypothetical protein C0447_00285 [Methylobacterium sp.]|nr:hypothetical protein [Methylobacterium sp.]